MNLELVAEIRAAAASLVTAAGAAEIGDLAATEIGIEDALFRVEGLLGRVRQMQLAPPVDPTPPSPPNGKKLDS